MSALKHAAHAAIVATLLSFACLASATTEAPAAKPAPPATTTADHAKFKQLQKHFDTGPEVTRECLGCHTEAAKQVHLTQHWRWEYRNPQTGQLLGKRHVINNFCTSVQSNQASCASCHIGYGMKDDKFDFSSEENVDCLVCHDRTGKYKKPGGFAGNPVTKDIEFPPGSGKTIRGIDLAEIAQKVGKTSRSTCGSCHFNGGGGDGVKHGDLDSSLEAPEKALDVHMAAGGKNFGCATCHKTEGHQVPGSRYAPTAADTGDARMRGKDEGSNPATCQACHGQKPHKHNAKLDDHTGRIACQTCHIPAFARGDMPTKMSWDWSTAGKRGPDGKPLVVTNGEGHVTYNGIKGDFVLADNVTPEYLWFNGKVDYTLAEDKIDKASQPIYINRFNGSADDGKSRIWPVKVFRGKQPYDAEGRTLVVTHLAGNDDTAYWTNLEWNKAVAAGMASVNRAFSGKVDFVETVSFWPITHMVAPKDKALGCADCHARGGRLEKVPGLYIPGRDRNPFIDGIGWLAAGALLVLTLGHGGVRFVRRQR